MNFLILSGVGIIDLKQYSLSPWFKIFRMTVNRSFFFWRMELSS